MFFSAFSNHSNSNGAQFISPNTLFEGHSTRECLLALFANNSAAGTSSVTASAANASVSPTSAFVTLDFVVWFMRGMLTNNNTALEACLQDVHMNGTDTGGSQIFFTINNVLWWIGLASTALALCIWIIACGCTSTSTEQDFEQSYALLSDDPYDGYSSSSSDSVTPRCTKCQCVCMPPYFLLIVALILQNVGDTVSCLFATISVYSSQFCASLLMIRLCIDCSLPSRSLSSNIVG